MGSVVIYHVQKYEIQRHYTGPAAGKSHPGHRRQARTGDFACKSPPADAGPASVTIVRHVRFTALAPESRQAAVGCAEVHSCINIYNFR